MGALNRFGPPSVRTSTSRVWALAPPGATATAISVPKTAVANIFRVKRSTLTCFIIHLFPVLSWTRRGQVQKWDRPQVTVKIERFQRIVLGSSSVRQKAAKKLRQP